jgi:hypothetical protein
MIMTKKLTITEINNKLLTKEMKVIGEYISSSVSTLVECKNGHQWKTRVANIIHRNDRCPLCFSHNHTKKWTTESINDFLSKRKIALISEYPGKVAKKGTFRCEYGHIWETTVASVISGRGCKSCYGKNMPLDIKTIQDRYKKFGYDVIGEYVNYSSVLKFICSNGHTWNSTVGNTRCSSCASYGFKVNRPSFGYILKFDSFIKYGISNSIQSRLYRHKLHNPPHEVVVIFKFNDGAKARIWENTIKTTIGGNYVGKDKCPDGWTETLPITLLETVIEKYDDSFRHIV